MAKSESAGAKVGPGTLETLKPDPKALAGLGETAGAPGTAVAPRQAQALGTLGGCGNLTFKPSRMLVAYPQSQWNADSQFRQGALVLDKTDLVVDPKAPVRCVILGCTRYWKPYYQDGMPEARKKLRWPDEAAAAAAGEITQFPPFGSDGAKPTAIEVGDFTLLIRRPDNCASTKFVLRLGGDWWALARFVVDKSWSKTKYEIAGLLAYEAGMRDAPPTDGKLNVYYARLFTEPVKNQSSGRTSVTIHFGFDAGAAGGPEKIPDKLAADLDALTGSAAGAAVADDDDAIPS